MSYIEFLLVKAAALCVLAFAYGVVTRIIETRPQAKRESPPGRID